jgi:hypothetical protein
MTCLHHWHHKRLTCQILHVYGKFLRLACLVCECQTNNRSYPLHTSIPSSHIKEHAWSTKAFFSLKFHFLRIIRHETKTRYYVSEIPQSDEWFTAINYSAFSQLQRNVYLGYLITTIGINRQLTKADATNTRMSLVHRRLMLEINTQLSNFDTKERKKNKRSHDHVKYNIIFENQTKPNLFSFPS